MKIKLVVLCFVFYSTISFAQGNRILAIKNIYIEGSCHGKYASGYINFDTFLEFEGDYLVQYLGSNMPGLRLYFDNILINESETFILKEDQDLRKIKVRFKIDRSIKDPHVTFSQNLNGQSIKDKIEINYGYFNVFSNSANVISESCQDSIHIVFPFQGTLTNVYLYRLIENEYVLENSFSYHCCSSGNALKIASNQQSKYKASIGGCHSKRSFEFELK